MSLSVKTPKFIHFLYMLGLAPSFMTEVRWSFIDHQRIRKAWFFSRQCLFLMTANQDVGLPSTIRGNNV